MMPRGASETDPFPGLDAAYIERHAAALRTVFDVAHGSRRLVIFGTSELGRRIANGARAAGLEVCATADNSEARRERDFFGARPLSAREAVERFGSSAVFVVAIYNPNAAVEQLRALGAVNVATFPAFFSSFPDCFEGMSGLAPAAELLAHETEIREAYELLADPVSRDEFAAQISWRCTLDDSLLPAPLPAGDMHFASGVYELSQTETLVDCGAYDGDSLRAFMSHTRGAFERIYALEPDPANRAKLIAHVDGLSPAKRSAVRILPFAAGDRNETIRFDAGLGVASGASGDGLLDVACRRLDDVIEGPATLVKMDIEGFEPKALRGAAALIRTSRPVLTICAYHYCEHLWELPKLVRTLAPDFRIFLRRYAEQCWETVYYAVPPERCIGTRHYAR